MSAPALYSVALDEWLDIGLDAGGNGGAIFTAGLGRSTYQTVVGDMVRDEQDFHAAGQHGKFVELHGVLGRMISWTGMLRLTEAALTSVLAQRDAFRMTSGVFSFIDNDGSQYDNCVLRAFALQNKIRIQVPGTSLVWGVPYSIAIEQVVP